MLANLRKSYSGGTDIGDQLQVLGGKGSRSILAASLPKETGAHLYMVAMASIKFIIQLCKANG